MEKKEPTRDYHVRLSKDEFENLQKKLEKIGMTKQEYGKRCLLNKDIVIIEGIPDLTDQIRRVGVNVNQAIKLANENKYINKNEILELIERLNEIWQLLNKFLSGNKVT